MSNREKSKQILLSYFKPGFYDKFFIANKSLNFLIVKIYDPKYSDGKIIPFRNKDCYLSPACVYDIEEVLDELEAVDFDKTAQQPCKICQKLIRMDKFYGDEDLFDKIGQVWQTYNQENVICHKIKIIQDGSFKAIVEKSQNPPIIQLKKLWKNGKLPDLKHFDKDELKNLIQSNFDDNELNERFVVLGKKVKKSDIMYFFKKRNLTETLICLICEYLQLYQKQKSTVYNKKFNNLHYFMVFKIRLSQQKLNSFKIQELFPLEKDQKFNLKFSLKHHRGLLLIYQYENNIRTITK